MVQRYRLIKTLTKNFNILSDADAGVTAIGHCVFYGVESWIGVLDWSHGVEYWS